MPCVAPTNPLQVLQRQSLERPPLCRSTQQAHSPAEAEVEVKKVALAAQFPFSPAELRGQEHDCRFHSWILRSRRAPFDSRQQLHPQQVLSQE
jgi:hypothetical protein